MFLMSEVPLYHRGVETIDRLKVGWLNGFSFIASTGAWGYHESSRCSRDTYPESYIIMHTSIQKNPPASNI